MLRKIKVDKSKFRQSLEDFLSGRGHEDYINELKKAILVENNGETEYQRGVNEGKRRAYIELINTYEAIK